MREERWSRPWKQRNFFHPFTISRIYEQNGLRLISRKVYFQSWFLPYYCLHCYTSIYLFKVRKSQTPKWNLTLENFRSSFKELIYIFFSSLDSVCGISLIFMFQRRSDLKIFDMCIFLCTQSSLESLSNIERFPLRSLLFFHFLTAKKWVQSKFRESKLKHFLLFAELLLPRWSIMVLVRSGCFNPQHNICQNEGFLFLAAGKEEEKEENLSAPWNAGLILDKGIF